MMSDRQRAQDGHLSDDEKARGWQELAGRSWQLLVTHEGFHKDRRVAALIREVGFPIHYDVLYYFASPEAQPGGPGNFDTARDTLDATFRTPEMARVQAETFYRAVAARRLLEPTE